MTKLKELRLKKRLRIADMCRMTGLSPYWYCMAENGVRIGVKAKEKIAKALDTPISELFPDSEAPLPTSSCRN